MAARVRTGVVSPVVVKRAPRVTERSRHWGQNIRAARQLLAMSQTDLGKAVDVRQSTVARWEKGEMVPRDDMKLRLAAVLRQEVRMLFPLYREVA